MQPHDYETALREKNAAALSSVLAAVLLTALKLGVGLSTNSLGILSEAAHSGLDLVAAAVTWFAVRISSRPPDARHPYGHGKVENLSALVETLLLLVTCGWIVWEAMHRLFVEPEIVVPSVWGLGVMGVSIVVDISRSRMLRRVAKKYNSQALEADALHFSTDIWSSAVVIVGLLALLAADLLPEGSALRPMLERADAVAALAVCVIVVHVSLSLGRRAVDALLDGGDAGLAGRIEDAVDAQPGVVRVERTRVRESGPHAFVDMTIIVAAGLSLDAAHEITRQAEAAVHEVAPGADVTIHFEPQQSGERGVLDRIRCVAAAHALPVHAVEVIETQTEVGAPQDLMVELHVELEGRMPLSDAHARVTAFEESLRAELGPLHVATHIEPAQDAAEASPPAPSRLMESPRIQAAVQAAADMEPGVCDCHHMHVRRQGEDISLSFHCRMAPETPVTEAHRVSAALEARLRASLPELHRVVVHMEPVGE